MTSLVVGGNSNINKLCRRVGIAEGNNWDVNIGSFFDGLGVGAGIRDDDQAWFLERSSNVVGEVTRCETTSNSNGSGVSSELEDSALTVRPGGDDTDISWVVDCSNDAGREDDLLPAE